MLCVILLEWYCLFNEFWVLNSWLLVFIIGVDWYWGWDWENLVVVLCDGEFWIRVFYGYIVLGFW